MKIDLRKSRVWNAEAAAAEHMAPWNEDVRTKVFMVLFILLLVCLAIAATRDEKAAADAAQPRSAGNIPAHALGIEDRMISEILAAGLF